jgi:hypothetical protein
VNTTHTNQRHTPRDTSPTSFIGRLNLEWEALRDNPTANARVAAWAATDQALTGLTSLDQVEEAITGRTIDDRIDAVFYALARRAAGSGQDASLAARVLTQLMLPKAILIARTCTRELRDPEEGMQLAVCALYEAIRTFPVHRRTHHIPSHLAWDTAHAVRRSVIAQTTEIADESVHQWPAAEEVTNSSEKIERLLAWAVAEQVITSLDARLLTARYCAEDGSRATWKSVGSLTVIAAETGLSLVAARKRCSRAARKIAAVVDAYPGPVVRAGQAESSPPGPASHPRAKATTVGWPGPSTRAS